MEEFGDLRNGEEEEVERRASVRAQPLQDK